MKVSLMTRPVLALDVDGVLNPSGSLSNLDPGCELHRIEIPACDVPDSPLVSGSGTRDLSTTVALNPSLHGAWITRLRGEYDVVWATTWEHTANTHLAPLLGIDPLPVGISVTTYPTYRGEDDDGIVSAWKARALSQSYPDRALVWIDDDNHAYATDPAWNTAHRWAAECDPRSGLTPAVMNRVETWLMHASRSM